MKRLILGLTGAMLVVSALAGPVAAKDFGAVYANDLRYRVFGNAANVPDGTGTDPLATFRNSTNAAQIGVAEFAPGDHRPPRRPLGGLSGDVDRDRGRLDARDELGGAPVVRRVGPDLAGPGRGGRLPVSGPREPRTDRLTPPNLVRRGATHRVRRASPALLPSRGAGARPFAWTRVDEPLRRNHDFRVVLVSQGISALGDAVSFTALPLLVFGVPGGLRGGHAGPCRASDTTATALRASPCAWWPSPSSRLVRCARRRRHGSWLVPCPARTSSSATDMGRDRIPKDPVSSSPLGVDVCPLCGRWISRAWRPSAPACGSA